MRMRFALGDGAGDKLSTVACSLRRMADRDDRRVMAAAYAGRAHDAHLGTELFRHSASELLAPASAQLKLSQTRTVTFGGRSSPALDHVEMRVEGRDLVDLGHAEFISSASACSAAGGTLSILDQVQILDQQRAARLIAEQRLDGSAT